MDGGIIQGNGLARALNAYRDALVKAGDVAAGKSTSLHGQRTVLAVDGCTLLYSP